MHLATRHKSPKCLALLMSKLELGEIDDQDNNKVQNKFAQQMFLSYIWG